MLKTEAKIYKLLENTNGIPKLRSYGQEGNFNYMVMDLLGNSRRFENRMWRQVEFEIGFSDRNTIVEKNRINP